jgi:hypothetical protein
MLEPYKKVYRMKYLILALPLLVVGCSSNNNTTYSSTLSYAELVSYPKDCTKANDQLAELRSIEKHQNFKSDPDELNDDDRAYNAQLKENIWWYAYECDKS